MERVERTRQVGRGAAVAMLWVIVGCGGGDVTGTPIPPGSDLLELFVSVSKSEFARGDSARITVTLHNTSNETVRVTFDDACTIVYGIRQAGGPVVVPSGGTWGCAPEPTLIELGPLGLTQRSFTWKGLGATAGDYLVFGALGAQMEDVSPAVSIRLVEP